MADRIEWTRRLYERMAAENGLPEDLLAEGVVWRTPPDVPRPMVLEGREKVMRGVGAFARSIDEFRVVPGEITDLGDRVVAAVTISGRPADGAPFEWGGAQVWWFDDEGLVAEVREFRSLPEAFETDELGRG